MDRSWLEKYNQPHSSKTRPEDEFDAFIELSNDPPVAFDKDKAWDQVSSRLSITPAKKQFGFAMVYKIAAVFLLVALSALLYQQTGINDDRRVEITATSTPLNYVLPDGSTVYLDAHSSISYLEDFNERIISFEGRGFYDVVKGETTFTIQMKDLNVTVLGTSFSLETYDNLYRSYVKEGLVEVADAHSTQKVNPGELLTYQKEDKQFIVSKNNNPNILAWKTGEFIFKNTPFDEVAENLEKYYKIDFLNADAFKKCTVTAEFNKQELTEVLAVLGEILNLEFKISKSEVKTLGKGCR